MKTGTLESGLAIQCEIKQIEKSLVDFEKTEGGDFFLIQHNWLSVEETQFVKNYLLNALHARMEKLKIEFEKL